MVRRLAVLQKIRLITFFRSSFSPSVFPDQMMMMLIENGPKECAKKLKLAWIIGLESPKYTMTIAFTTKPLYGGAITMSVPADMIDASEFRQVPDTQEVYVAKENPDYSVIVDLLECVPGNTLTKALDEHMEEITRLNGVVAGKSKVLSQHEVSSNEPMASLSGVRVFEQQVPKFGKQADTESVVIAIALLRLKAPASTDILITFNRHVTGPEDEGASSLASVEEAATEMLKSLSVRSLDLFVS